jgi:TfoX/Sxy family transcriptional regulator of competence genes
VKYYAEPEMKSVRVAFEKKVLSWPQVTSKFMFGCPCYLAQGKMFAILVTGGVVITKLDAAGRKAVAEQLSAAPFAPQGMPMKSWVRVPLREAGPLKRILPWVEKSYEAARKLTG